MQIMHSGMQLRCIKIRCILNLHTKCLLYSCLGLKDFKILPLEPLAIDSIKIGESEGSMSLKQEYKNIKIYGITKDMQLYNYRCVIFYNYQIINFSEINWCITEKMHLYIYNQILYIKKKTKIFSISKF